MERATTSHPGHQVTGPAVAQTSERGPNRSLAVLYAGLALLTLAGAFAAVMAARPGRPPTAGLDRWWLSVVTMWQATPLTRAGEVLSYVAGPWGGTVLVAVVVVLLLWRRRIWPAVFLALAEAAGSGASQLIKHLVERPRPPHPLVRTDFGSFPSGHVITTVVVGLALVAVLGRPGHRRLPLAGVAAAALLMMCCRTYLRAHWLTDTFESVMVAAGIALVLWFLFTPALRRPRQTESQTESQTEPSRQPNGEPGHQSLVAMM